MRSHPRRAGTKPAVVDSASHLRLASVAQSFRKPFIHVRARPKAGRDATVSAGLPGEKLEERL